MSAEPPDQTSTGQQGGGWRAPPPGLTIDSAPPLLPVTAAPPGRPPDIPRAASSLPPEPPVSPSLIHADASGLAVLRAWVEYHAGYREQTVTLARPGLISMQHLLHDVFADQPPRGLILPELDADVPAVGEWPGSTILVSRCVTSPQDAGRIAVLLANTARASCSAAQQLLQLAGAGIELPENALVHGRNSPIGATVCAMRHGPTDTLQLAVVDLGQPVTPRTRNALAAAVTKNATSYLNTQAAFWEDAGLKPRIVLTSGAERLDWTGRRWTSSRPTGDVHGFVAFVAFPAHL